MFLVAMYYWNVESKREQIFFRGFWHTSRFKKKWNESNFVKSGLDPIVFVDHASIDPQACPVVQRAWQDNEMRMYNTNTNLNMNLAGRYGASIGRSLGCSELHRCEQPFRARPADVIIIERQQRQANWHEARNVCSSRTNGCYRESPVIKAKEYKLRQLWAMLLARIRRYEWYD